jgi:arsenite-transporting ATPase
LGKGGVGKSTLSALNSLSFAQNGYKTLLVSMDPAHNQTDIFEKTFGEKAIAVSEYLSVMEIDLDLWIKRYLKEVQERISDSYRYLSAVNLDKKFDVLKYSPGLEEYALLTAFDEILKKYADFDYLIFDMPPTALSLRFFTLPKLSLIWIDNLLEIRKEILQKAEIISRIKFGSSELERDKVLNRLQELRQRYDAVYERFKEKETLKINIVLNEDQLSFKESLRIMKKLDDLGINAARLHINKSLKNGKNKNIGNFAKNMKIYYYPYSDYPLIGIEALYRFLKTLA